MLRTSSHSSAMCVLIGSPIHSPLAPPDASLEALPLGPIRRNSPFLYEEWNRQDQRGIAGRPYEVVLLVRAAIKLRRFSVSPLDPSRSDCRRCAQTIEHRQGRVRE